MYFQRFLTSLLFVFFSIPITIFSETQIPITKEFSRRELEVIQVAFKQSGIPFDIKVFEGTTRKYHQPSLLSKTVADCAENITEACSINFDPPIRATKIVVTPLAPNQGIQEFGYSPVGIKEVSPNLRPAIGDIEITISGDGFIGTKDNTSVTLVKDADSDDAHSLDCEVTEVSGNDKIKCRSPQETGFPGDYDVQVDIASDMPSTYYGIKAKAVTYQAQPPLKIARISPGVRPSRGEQEITISGEGFLGSIDEVYVDLIKDKDSDHEVTLECSVTAVIDSKTIKCNSPENLDSPGSYDVVVEVFSQDALFSKGLVYQACSPGAMESQICSVLNGSGKQSGTCNAAGSAFEAWGACTAQSCNTGYYLSGGVCLAQICSPGATGTRACSVSNGSGTQMGTCNSNGSAVENYGACTGQSCNSGYYLSGGVCLPQICSPGSMKTQACSISNGAGTQLGICNFNGSAVENYGACTAQSCDEGYYLSGVVCNATTVDLSSILLLLLEK